VSGEVSDRSFGVLQLNLCASWSVAGGHGIKNSIFEEERRRKRKKKQKQTRKVKKLVTFLYCCIDITGS
jgi:hypothetical protein